MHKPVIIIALAYIAGLLLGHGFLYFPFSISGILVLSLLAAGIATWFGKVSLRQYLILFIPGVVGMAAYVYATAWFPADHYTRVFQPGRNSRLITGIVASPFDRNPGRTAFALSLLDIDGVGVNGKVRVNVREELTSLGYMATAFASRAPYPNQEGPITLAGLITLRIWPRTASIMP